MDCTYCPYQGDVIYCQCKNMKINSTQDKFVFDEIRINKFSIFEKILLLFRPIHIVQDTSFNDLDCTVKYKTLFGRIYIIDSILK